MRTLKTRSERSGLWEGRVFHPSGAIRDVRPRKCQSRMALRGAALTHFYKLSRGRRNLQGVGQAGEPFANVGSTNAHGREWLSGNNNSPEGLTVTTSVSYGCWPRLTLTNSGTGRCDKAAHLSERRATCLRGGLQVALALGLATVVRGRGDRGRRFPTAQNNGSVPTS
jgi:hypothetical protein